MQRSTTICYLLSAPMFLPLLYDMIIIKTFPKCIPTFTFTAAAAAKTVWKNDVRCLRRKYCDVIGFINIVDTLKKANFLSCTILPCYTSRSPSQRKYYMNRLASIQFVFGGINCNIKKFSPSHRNMDDGFFMWCERFSLFNSIQKNQRQQLFVVDAQGMKQKRIKDDEYKRYKHFCVHKPW